MSGRGPAGGEHVAPVFVRHQTGTVHVGVPADLLDAWWDRKYRERPLFRELYPRNAVTALLAAPTPMLCGHLAIRPRDGGRDGFVEHFPDTALCATCRMVWDARIGDVADLFAHPQTLAEVDA